MWHVLKAWAEQLRRKLQDKSRFHEAYGMLQRIAGMQVPGTLKEVHSTVDDAIRCFESRFHEETEVIAWFQRAWKDKRGEQDLMCCSECWTPVGLRRSQSPQLMTVLPERAELWVKCFQVFHNTLDCHTTAHCEGYHLKVKYTLRAMGSEALQVDKLIWFFLEFMIKAYVRRELPVRLV